MNDPTINASWRSRLISCLVFLEFGGVRLLPAKYNYRVSDLQLKKLKTRNFSSA